MNLLLTALVPLVDQAPDPEDVKPGWLGLTVFLLLAAAVAFLAFSLRKHLGKVNFEEQPSDNGNGSDNGADSNGADNNGTPHGGPRPRP